MMTSNKKRFVLWIILIVFSFVIFGSSTFIISHTDHDCTGEECTVCIELAECYKTLNTLGTALIGGVHLSAMMFVMFVTVRSFTKTTTDHSTLISLKVELLN
jgi:hypothetical protein